LTNYFVSTEKAVQVTSEHIEIFMAIVDFDNLLLLNAQRKSYGVPPKNFNLWEDESEEAVWAWELVAPSLHLANAYILKKKLANR